MNFKFNLPSSHLAPILIMMDPANMAPENHVESVRMGSKCMVVWLKE